jgi:hypothetical protein
VPHQNDLKEHSEKYRICCYRTTHHSIPEHRFANLSLASLISDGPRLHSGATPLVGCMISTKVRYSGLKPSRAPCPLDDADSECQVRLGFCARSYSDGLGNLVNTDNPNRDRCLAHTDTLVCKAASAEVGHQCRYGNGGTSMLRHIQCHCHGSIGATFILEEFLAH